MPRLQSHVACRAHGACQGAVLKDRGPPVFSEMCVESMEKCISRGSEPVCSHQPHRSDCIALRQLTAGSDPRSSAEPRNVSEQMLVVGLG